MKLNGIFLHQTLCASTFALCANGLVKWTPGIFLFVWRGEGDRLSISLPTSLSFLFLISFITLFCIANLLRVLSSLWILLMSSADYPLSNAVVINHFYFAAPFPVYETIWRHRINFYIHYIDATFSIYWSESRKILSMVGFEHKLSKNLVSKFVLKYNIKPWGIFSPRLLLV